MGSGEGIISQSNYSIRIVASPATHEKIAQVIKQIDQPPQSKRVRVIWLVSGMKRDAPVPGADLKDVVAGLENMGVEDLRVAAHVMVRCLGNQSFQLGSQVLLADNPLQYCDLQIDGQFRERDGRPRGMRINIRANEEVRPVEQQGFGVKRVTRKTLAQLSTTISAPPGHAVVLGVSPIGKLTSVFVVTTYDE